MIIEIGTSDFRTQAGQVDGVFIEPVKYYYDRMVDLALKRDEDFDGGMELYAPTTYFENVAISDYEGEATCWYIPRHRIKEHDLPEWVAGCSRMGHGWHPSIITACKDAGVDITQVMYQTQVKVVRIKSIIEKYNITSLDLLKIDTEGHDCIILNDYLNTVEILPKVIQFESNELSDPKEVAKVVARLKPLGYDCKQVKFDMVCTLK
jgi:FkbM family methyltransferase